MLSGQEGRLRRSAVARPYRETLVLRFYEGLPPRRIAERMGVPVATVHTRTKRGLAVLRARLDREFEGGRSAWSALLVPLVAAPPGWLTTEAARELALEVLAMSTKAKVVSMACALVALALVVAVRVDWDRELPRSPGQQSVRALAPEEAESLPQRAEEPLSSPATPEEARVAAAPAETQGSTGEQERFGTLELRVVGADDGAPRPGEWLRVVVSGVADGLLSGIELRTDSAGRARVERLSAGCLQVFPLRGNARSAELAPGKMLELTVELARGFDVHGVVVDTDGAPVEGANIWLSEWSHDWARVVATSDREGAFLVSEFSGLRLLGARSEHHTPSPTSYARASDSGRTLRLVLLRRRDGGPREPRAVRRQAAGARPPPRPRHLRGRGRPARRRAPHRPRHGADPPRPHDRGRRAPRGRDPHRLNRPLDSMRHPYSGAPRTPAVDELLRSTTHFEGWSNELLVTRR